MDTKDLIERLRHGVYGIDRIPLCAEAADALERLTQPVGEVDAIGWLTDDGRVTVDPAAPIKFGKHWRVPIYSAETVARLIAERDAALRVTFDPKVLEDMNALQERVKLLEGHKMLLRHALLSADERMNLDISRYGIGDEDYTAIRKALAATEPKGETK